jgi:glc operon protein GlcG
MTVTSRLVMALFAPAILASAEKPHVTYFSKEKVDAAFANGGVLLAGDTYRVQASHHDAPGQVEIHHLDTLVMYIVEGSATFVTGGTVSGSKLTEPNELRGGSSNGGQEQHVSKGDVIVVPNDTPHWFKEVSTPFNYFVVKVR